MWGELEPAIGIILACAPMIKPLVLGDSSKNRSSPANTNALGSSGKEFNGQRSFEPLDDDYPLQPIAHNDAQSVDGNASSRYAASSGNEEGLQTEPYLIKNEWKVRSE